MSQPHYNGEGGEANAALIIKGGVRGQGLSNYMYTHMYMYHDVHVAQMLSDLKTL